MAIKRCTSAFAAVVDGAPRVVTVGTLVEDTDSVFKGREQLFEDVNTYVSRRSGRAETASAEPDEKRSLPSRRAGRKGAGRPSADTSETTVHGGAEQQEGRS
ncbi:hypothetical protein [Streptomyces sp. NPDC058872]|uniref:hypothetical protein n=1 Tax=Streptomyces sp. NPDC058872 TaxID=3346661 RepID=UPI0036BD666D